MHVWVQWKKMTCLTIWPPEWLFCFQEGLGCMELACICCLEYCIYHHLTPAVQRYAPQYLNFFSNCVQIFGHSIWRFSIIFIVAYSFYVQRSAICVLCFCDVLKCYVIFITAFHIFVYYVNQYYLSFEQSFVV
jgi:hypothetical protein